MSDDSRRSQKAHSDDADREERFDEICADFLDAEADGLRFDQDNALAENPDLAESLRNFFQDHARMAGALHDGNEDSEETVPPPTPMDVEQTIAYTGDETANQNFESNDGLHVRIADYELIEKIAQGGMGVVYKAQQLSLNRIVALKMIRSGALADAEEVKRFRVEAKAAAQLRHPGIVPIYQIGVEDGQDFFSMAYIEGESLADRARREALLPKEAANYVMKVARAVQYAHDQGIIHRDIKPANVLLDKNDNPMVMDFGLAKQIQSDHQLTMSGQILGTASYMSPEQARGDQAAIGPASDIYSLGALLYTLLTQRPPFTGDNPIEIILNVLSKDPDAPSASNMRLSRDIETICMKCLEKKPAKRYSSAQELADDLKRFLDGVPINARPVSKFEHAIRWCQRKPAITTSIVLAIGLVLGLPIAYYNLREVVVKKEDDRFEIGLAQDAKKQYVVDSDLLDPDRYEGQDRLYILAAKAMLTQVGNRSANPITSLTEPSRAALEDTVRELEQALEQTPKDELRFALADCFVTFSRDASIEKDKHKEKSYLERAEQLLLELENNSGSPSELLLRRIEWIRFVKAQLSPNYGADDLRKFAKAKVRKLDNAYGIIRFEFEHLPLSQPVQHFAEPHEALMKDKASGLNTYISFLGAQDNLDLSSHETQQLFCDLALLSQRIVSDDGASSPESLPVQAWPWIWPKDPRGIYDAILGIALSQTNYAPRDFQVR